MNRLQLRKFSRNCCVHLFNLPELGYSTATSYRKFSSLSATTRRFPFQATNSFPNDQATPRLRTARLRPFRAQATNSLSTPFDVLVRLPVGSTNTAGLDPSIEKRLIGTAGDSGVQDRLQNEERSPHTSPKRGEKQRQNKGHKADGKIPLVSGEAVSKWRQPTKTTRSTRTNNNKQEQFPTTKPPNNKHPDTNPQHGKNFLNG